MMPSNRRVRTIITCAVVSMAAAPAEAFIGPNELCQRRNLLLYTTTCPPTSLPHETWPAEEFRTAKDYCAPTPSTDTHLELIVVSADSKESPTHGTNCEKNESASKGERKEAEESIDTEGDESENEGTDFEKNRHMAARAALLGRNSRNRKGPSTRASKSKTTSVGARRTGSATRARQAPGSTSKMMDAIRKAARGATASPSPEADTNISTPPSQKPGPTNEMLSNSAVQISIQSAIGDMLQRNFDQNNESQASRFVSAVSSLGKSVGILGEQPFQHQHEPLSAPLAFSPNGRTLVRVATPKDDFEVANLRLSVFSDFSVDQRGQFCARSCEAIANRRKRGAICVVATKDHGGTSSVDGTAECSFHEFRGTQLGQRRPNSSILYVTEFAVHPAMRRQGIGSMLLGSIDDLSFRLGIETIYLHVDVCNSSAIALYQKCGYQMVDAKEPIFEEFTKSLNLHPGATKGRSHHLLFKDLRPSTWLQPRTNLGESQVVGTLGFEIPA